MLCPKDLKPCIDDLCYGGGCIFTGEAMYSLCSGCGNYSSDDDDMDCTCPPGDDDWEEFDDEMDTVESAED